ncbi:hypothetical protein MKX01_009340 [Papaver californicum]|nr:hypothetical protein MKX01_009340 [Papaver californicum]
MEEEAQHLKDDAEIKFKAQDFARALWLANLAQDINPNLCTITTTFACRTNENTTNFTKVRVSDWYGVLEISDDDSVDIDTIKKQYKRMELLVHPDKNDSVAAEGAFKLVQDALDILSDPDMRKGFEIERNRSRAQPTSSRSTPSKQGNTKPSFNRQRANYKAGNSSSYYDDREEAEDTWLLEEEDEEAEIKSETRPCPTSCYPCYVQTYKKVCSSVVYCRNCDRIIMFS